MGDMHKSGSFSALFLLVRRSLRQHALSTGITVFSVALASGLVMAVFSVKTQTHEAFTGGSQGFDAILGARGSQLQLVLNCVFHLETSPGNIPWKMYKEIKTNPFVELAIPYMVGDNYKGFRIVGTTEEIFTRLEYQEGKRYTFRSGEPFDPQSMDAVLGSYVAQKTGLKVNAIFKPYHGLFYDEATQHEDEYRVVGVLNPTNTPADRAIWIPIDGLFRMSGHKLRGKGEAYEAKAGEEIPEEHKEVSAVMLKFRGEQAGMLFDQTINRQGDRATLAWPIARVMAEFFEKIGLVDRVLALVAYLVCVVAAGSILASLYNTMNERRREFAILRSLGARRSTIFSAILLESSAIAALGSLAGFAVYAAIVWVAAAIIKEKTGVVLDVFRSGTVEWGTHQVAVVILAPLGMIGMGALAGIIPAYKAYATDVASNLAPLS